LYAVYICQKSLNFIYAFKCYQQIAINAGLSWPHFSWPTLYLQVPCTREKMIAWAHGLLRAVNSLQH